MNLTKRLNMFAHVCRHKPRHKLCAERVIDAVEDIRKLEIIIQEMVFVSHNHEVLASYPEHVDLSEKVSFPERLREVLE